MEEAAPAHLGEEPRLGESRDLDGGRSCQQAPHFTGSARPLAESARWYQENRDLFGGKLTLPDHGARPRGADMRRWSFGGTSGPAGRSGGGEGRLLTVFPRAISSQAPTAATRYATPTTAKHNAGLLSQSEAVPRTTPIAAMPTRVPI